MKKTVEAGSIPEAWSAEALYNKAQRYAERMIEAEYDWEQALWSSFSLELLARATLANVSPALLAAPENWSNLLHSLGFTPNETKFSPKSIHISEVIKRLGSIFADFNKELQSFCNVHTGRRNTELHSGETAFDGVSKSSWQPRYFQACAALLDTIELQLVDFFGPEEADVALKLIEAANDQSAKAAQGDVDAHEKVWESKDDREKGLLLAAARAAAARSMGHCVTCPACGCPALVNGDPIGAPTKRLNEDLVVETQKYLPTQFQCVACGLKLLGLSRLNAINLGDRFTKTETYDAAEYFVPEDNYPGYEDDNNEPY